MCRHIQVLHVCGQIDIVRQKLGEITQKDVESGMSESFMKQLIVRHQRIISFSQSIEALYSNIALVQFVSNTMIICCLGFLIVIVSIIRDAQARFLLSDPHTRDESTS